MRELVRFTHILGAVIAVGPDSPVYVAYRSLMRRLSPVIAIGTLTILYLMVMQPGS